MDFNALKNILDQDDTSTLRLPKKMDELKKVQLPMDRIKQNMRSEIYMQFGAMAFFSLVPFIHPMPALAQYLFWSSLIAVAAITLIYVLQLQHFLKQQSKVTMGSLLTLSSYIQQLKATLAVYKTGVIASSLVLPFTFGFFYLSLANTTQEAYTNKLIALSSANFFLPFLVVYLLLVLAIYYITEWWTKKLYGTYLTDLETTLAQLDDEA